MLFGNGKPRPRAARRRVPAYRFEAEGLEVRVVPATVDLANISGSATQPGLGVQLVAANSSVSRFNVAALGDVNGDGFQDFLIGSPSTSTAYLVFGSFDASAGNINWLTLGPNQRVGDLAQLGSLNQSNPLQAVSTGQFNYNGLSFTTSSNPNSQLGTSVAAIGDVNGDGFNDFLIGAPAANGNVGEAYVVYGGNQLATRSIKNVDLDAGASDVSIQRFSINTATTVGAAIGGNAQVGAAVGFAGSFFGTARGAIAIGAPGATISNGVAANGNGAVFVVPNAALSPAPAGGTTGFIDLSGVGQGGTGSGVTFSGPTSGALVNMSLADAGNVDAANGEDLLVGAPHANNTAGSATITNTGAAYLIYGNTTFGTGVVRVNGFSNIPLSSVGLNNASGTLVGPRGATFFGTAPGDLTGFSVASAGNFNGDNFADFLIGSPGFRSSTGQATLVYGGAFGSTGNTGSNGQATSTVTPAVVGNQFTLNSTLGGFQSAGFVGTATGDEAGFSVGPSGKLGAQTGPVNPILIGSPGFNAGAGAVYLLPGTTNTLIGNGLPLASFNNTTLAGTLITDSGTAATTGAVTGLGASVNGIVGTTRNGLTADGDGLADFAIGASNFSFAQPRVISGTAFILEGARIPLGTPRGGQQGGIGGIDGQTGQPPFNITVTTTANSIQILVDSSVGPPQFNPVTDINPATLVIDGVPAASFSSVTIAASPVDVNGDGIPDAIITATPRTAVGLVPGNGQRFTLAGITTATAANPTAPFLFTTTVNVSNGSNNNGGGGLPTSGNVSSTFGFPKTNPAGSNIGERLVPLANTLSPLTWKPLPLKFAFRQFLPSHAYQVRHLEALGKKVMGNHSNKANSPLKQHVYNRSRFKLNAPIGKVIHHHAGKTVPPTV